MSKVTVVRAYRPGQLDRELSHDWTLARWQALFPAWKLLEVDSDPNEPFSRSKSRNDAYHAALADPECEVVVFADADTAPCRNAMISAAAMTGAAGWALPYTRYINLTQASTNQVLFSKPGEHLPQDLAYEHCIPSPPVPPYQDPVSGILCVSRALLAEAGGYDENFRGWGYEDNEFAERLRSFQSTPYRVDSFVLHLWHPAPDSSTWSQPYIEANRRLYARLSATHRKAEMERLLTESIARNAEALKALEDL